MTIQEAVAEMVESSEFKNDAKQENYLRTFLRRHRNNELGNGAAVEMLIRYNYEVIINKKETVVKKGAGKKA